MRDKLLLVGLMLALGVALVPIFQPSSQSRVGQDLPWQVTEEDNGALTVFGLTLGESTLGEAVAKLGNRYDIAVFRDRNGRLSLEAFFRDAILGGLSARLVLDLQVDAAVLQQWLSNVGEGKRLPDGVEQYPLVEDDAELAMELPIASITYVPQAKLDEALVRQRFGDPSEVIVVRENERHFLYPEQGLDLRLDEQGKAVLQYVPISEFERVRAPLKGATPSVASSGPAT